MTTTPTTSISRRQNSIQATTLMVLGECLDHRGRLAQRILEITTRKSASSKGLTASAFVYVLSNDGGKSFCIPTSLCGDDRSTCLTAPNTLRCTEKNVRAIHAEAMTQYETLLASVRAWYQHRDSAAGVEASA